MPAMHYPTCVTTYLPLFYFDTLPQGFEPCTSALKFIRRVQSNIEGQHTPIAMRLQFTLAAFCVIFNNKPICNTKFSAIW
mmetsp:Transcript_9779/g.16213  ORF Transcript_9779/g.16213 Transcript_9779/m.16213 type:complete len:80 (-) Transcript_9779:411-650(-)